MVRRGIFIIFSLVLVLLLTNAGAISSDMKSSYMKGETAVVKLSGPILEPITKDQIEFKRDNVRMPFLYDVAKLGDAYYIWFIVSSGASEGNYSMGIKDVFTYVTGTTQSVDFIQNFTVNSNLADYTINPGFIFAKGNFSMVITSQANDSMTLNINQPESKDYNILPGDNKIEFNIKDFTGTQLTTMKIGNYTIPLYVVRDGFPIITEKKNNSLSISPGFIDATKLKSATNINYTLTIQNTGINNMVNIYLDYNTDIFSITPSGKTSLNSDEQMQYDITIKESYRKSFDEIINITSKENNISRELPIKINFVDNYSVIDDSIHVSANNSQGYLQYTCSELIGNKCANGQACKGTEIVGKDGLCCRGICGTGTTTKTSSAWIGYLLAIILIGILGYVYYNYKKVKADKDPIKTQIREAEKKNRKNLP
ncbi:MAG: hypothetical protein WCK29_03450 [archaeon]